MTSQSAKPKPTQNNVLLVMKVFSKEIQYLSHLHLGAHNLLITFALQSVSKIGKSSHNNTVIGNF